MTPPDRADVGGETTTGGAGNASAAGSGAGERLAVNRPKARKKAHPASRP